MNGKRDEEQDLDKMVEWAHQRDGVIEKERPERKVRVIPYEEVAARLHARSKK